jgi:hypothetical protein
MQYDVHENIVHAKIVCSNSMEDLGPRHCCTRAKVVVGGRFPGSDRRIGETMQSASSYAIKTNDCDFMLRISARVLMAIT